MDGITDGHLTVTVEHRFWAWQLLTVPPERYSLVC